MNKEARLKLITQEISRCRRCRKGASGKPVSGEGSPNADIVFIGEAPGREEAKTGRPFVGRSGKFLRSLIRGVGLKEEDVFITSPVKYLPNRGTPTNDDITHGRTHLIKQLTIISPKVVVLLGKTAYHAFFEKSLPILHEHGKVILKDGRKYFITLHPAAALRFPKYQHILEADFKKLKELLIA